MPSEAACILFQLVAFLQIMLHTINLIVLMLHHCTCIIHRDMKYYHMTYNITRKSTTEAGYHAIGSYMNISISTTTITTTSTT